MKRAICFYLHVHQPLRIKRYSVFDGGHDHEYFNDETPGQDLNNRFIIDKVSEKSYLPTNEKLLGLLNRHPEFKLSMSMSGVLLEQLENWRPDVLKTFQDLVRTGQVEIAGETYEHSLAFFYSKEEFARQVDRHKRIVKKFFSQEPQVFRNTELAYNNDLAKWAEDNGYKGILAEGWDPVLGWRSPNFVYQPPNTKKIKLLLKNYKLSDDIAFRFSNQSWEGWPLTAEKFAHWIDAIPEEEPLVNLFMDYETFGEHQWGDTGIFDFLEHLPEKYMRGRADHGFMTLSEAVEAFEPVDTVDMPYTVTWADTERDLTAWLGNSMQQEAITSIYDIEDRVLATEDDKLINDWRRMQTSDHFYYMCTKWFNDGDVHAYFSPYDNPYDAFISYMNALRDLKLRLIEHEESG